jgi:rod shape-determining protein MreC
VASGRTGRLALAACLGLVSISLYCLPEEHKQAVAARLAPVAFAPGLAVARQAEALVSVAAVNRTLRSSLTALALENFRLRKLQRENQRLRALLTLKESSRLQLQAVRVIGRKQTALGLTLILEEGASAGVRPHKALMTHQGLVGRVVWAGPLYATAQTLLEKDSRVSVLVARSRVPGILVWAGGSAMEMHDVPLEADVQMSDSIVTSGFGGVFPKGILVGSVVKIGDDERVPLKQVRVKPSVDFRRLEEVFMIQASEPSPDRGSTG